MQHFMSAIGTCVFLHHMCIVYRGCEGVWLCGCAPGLRMAAAAASCVVRI